MEWGVCRGRTMPQPAFWVHGLRPGGFQARLFSMALLGLLLAAASPLRAGVHFENCVTAADGAITCDTVPTGNTLADDEAARFGLFANASPGWNEFDPYAGYEDDFGAIGSACRGGLQQVAPFAPAVRCGSRCGRSGK